MAEVKEQSVDGFGKGNWALGPEALHGGPKHGAGFAQSTGGSASSSASAAPKSNAADRLAQLAANPTEVPEQAQVSKDATPKVTKIRWDEETIAEHDLERGTRQKIEEPNTPWMGSPSGSARESAIHSSTPVIADHSEDGDAQPIAATSVPLEEQDVEERLQTWFRKEKHRVSIQEQWGDLPEQISAAASRDAEDLSLEEKKARDFAEKRKQHYKIDLKAMRAAAVESDEDEDESEDD